MKRWLSLVCLLVASLLGSSQVLAAGPTPTPTTAVAKESKPAVNPKDFVDKIDNPFLPFRPGTTFIYEGLKGTDPQRNEVKVTHETKKILGVDCVVVNDRVTQKGELVEATLDWYAQDKKGNVWYFGEDAKEYQNGKVISTEGSWEAGVNGAQPGIVMEADPKAGDKYRQEFAKGVAEDSAKVLAVIKGRYLATEESTALAPDDVEHKYYVAGVGFVAGVKITGEFERSELVSIQTE
jgi:hypothetical protein